MDPNAYLPPAEMAHCGHAQQLKYLIELIREEFPVSTSPVRYCCWCGHPIWIADDQERREHNSAILNLGKDDLSK